MTDQSSSDRDELENLIGKSLGWIKYDKPEDYEMSPFGGMWVEHDGKTGHDISGLMAALQSYIAQHTKEAERRARIDELGGVRLGYGPYIVETYISGEPQTIEKRLAELASTNQPKDKEGE